jgi:hypothetical protein
MLHLCSEVAVASHVDHSPKAHARARCFFLASTWFLFESAWGASPFVLERDSACARIFLRQDSEDTRGGLTENLSRISPGISPVLNRPGFSGGSQC